MLGLESIQVLRRSMASSTGIEVSVGRKSTIINILSSDIRLIGCICEKRKEEQDLSVVAKIK